MNGIRLFITLLALSAIVALNSCSEPAGPKKYPAPVTYLLATSIDSNSIMIQWQPSATEVDPAFDRYIVKINGTDGYSRSDTILRVSNPHKISGLNQDYVYGIDIYTMIKGGELSEKTSVVWAPAFRFTEESSGEPIRVYEQASLNGCGLDLYDTESNRARVLTLDSSHFWNLGLSVGNNVQFGTPSLLNFNYKDNPPCYTEISDFYYDTPTLDIVYTTDPLSIGVFSQKLINLTEIETQIKSHLIVIVRTKEPGQSLSNYAKILIKKIDGKFLQGTANNRYIECEISYQKSLSVPYAKKPIH